MAITVNSLEDIPKLKGAWLNDNCQLLEAPTFVEGQWRCLADYNGMLFVIQLSATAKLTNPGESAS